MFGQLSGVTKINKTSAELSWTIRSHKNKQNISKIELNRLSQILLANKTQMSINKTENDMSQTREWILLRTHGAKFTHVANMVDHYFALLMRFISKWTHIQKLCLPIRCNFQCFFDSLCADFIPKKRKHKAPSTCLTESKISVCVCVCVCVHFILARLRLFYIHVVYLLFCWNSGHTRHPPLHWGKEIPSNTAIYRIFS